MIHPRTSGDISPSKMGRLSSFRQAWVGAQGATEVERLLGLYQAQFDCGVLIAIYWFEKAYLEIDFSTGRKFSETPSALFRQLRRLVDGY